MIDGSKDDGRGLLWFFTRVVVPGLAIVTAIAGARGAWNAADMPVVVWSSDLAMLEEESNAQFDRIQEALSDLTRIFKTQGELLDVRREMRSIEDRMSGGQPVSDGTMRRLDTLRDQERDLQRQLQRQIDRSTRADPAIRAR